MREIGQETVPTSETDKEFFLSLRLAEPSERVKITLDERMLSIEGKRNATIDMRLHAISTMKHHSTNLVPGWLVVLGLSLIWIGYRLMVPATYRLAFVGGGSALIAARLLTKKPTLTVQTSSGDTHVLFGNERTLNRLSFMFHHLINNKSMAEVRAKLKAIEDEVGAGWREEEPLPTHRPNPLHVPTAVNQFLAASGEGTAPQPAHELEPDWMPTHDPEPPATGLVGFIPSFQPVMAASPPVYPPDHRPAPVQHPVLVPQPIPPMYQGLPSSDGPTFLPSFYGQDGAHVPGLHQEPTQEDTDEHELHLDADLFGGDEETIEAAVEETIRPEALTPPNPPETRLKPRARTSLQHSPFRPRRTEALKPRERRSGGVISRIRDRSSDFFGRAAELTRSSPFATSETSGALREQAAEAARTSNGRVMGSLSQEHGGVMSPEEADRLRRREEMLLATADELNQTEEGRLETLSFSDLRSSQPVENHLNMPRLDED